VDEDTDADAKAIGASFADPYILILKDDSSIFLLKTDKKGELDEIDLGPDLSQGKYTSAVLYCDQQGIFTGRKSGQGTPLTAELCCFMALLSQDGSFSIYAVSDLENKVFHYEGVHFLPSVLSHNTPLPRHWKGGEALSELLIADLGDSNGTDPYLILRTAPGETIVYKAFSFPPADEDPNGRAGLGFKNMSLRQTSISSSTAPGMAVEETTRKLFRPMKPAFVGGKFLVMIPGQSPAMIARATNSSPHIYTLPVEAVLAFSSHHSATCPQGFAFVDKRETLITARLPAEILLGHSDWVWRKVELNLDVRGVAYLERTRSYVLASNSLEDCQLPQDDEWHPEWKNEDTSCLPQLERGTVNLLSSTSFHVVDSYQLDYAERAMCIKSMNLEVSEETHERKDLIVVGTAIIRGEDVLARGSIYIFDVVDVVPQPGVSETDLKLKLIAKEEVKGAVTSLSEIGSQGFMLAAQGQKCMVRGLKEDLTILPVAFMDMKYYVNVAKELAGTGLCILGDAISGLWFVGYSVSLSHSCLTSDLVSATKQ
jgi:cleavage and polyadenylation specificity factor subunit 1